MNTDLENLIHMLSLDDGGLYGDMDSPQGCFANVVVTKDEIDEAFKKSYSNFLMISPDFDWDNLPGFYFLHENSNGVINLTKYDDFESMYAVWLEYHNDYVDYINLEDA